MPSDRTNIALVVLLLTISIVSASSRFQSMDRFSVKHLKETIIGLNNVGPQDGRKMIVERQIILPGLNYTREGDVADDYIGHHAGYYNIVHSNAARLFYYFFESRESGDDPVVLWLTGGPGCSSELAIFYENGPFKFVDDMSLVWNNHGWDKVSNIIYVDQPIGTGFSYSSDKNDLRHNENGISNDLYDFMQAFLEEHFQYVNNDFYIIGESYAGHYIPAFANRIYQGNQQNQGIHINLKGIAIGNGLTNPSIQYSAYTDYAFDMGLITESDKEEIDKNVPKCLESIENCDTTGTSSSCSDSFRICNNDIYVAIVRIAGNVNIYDIRADCGNSNLCYDFSNMDKYLNKKSVKDSLGVGDKVKFELCSPAVYDAMQNDWMRNFDVDIPKLVENGIKLLVYAGEYDLICNWIGNSRWVSSMKWTGQRKYNSAPTVRFVVDTEEAGELKSYENVSFVKVFDAGHMAPMDQPRVALTMLKRWMNGKLTEEERTASLFQTNTSTNKEVR